ncbi:NADPH:quinone reductase [Streptomyces spiroverticillatus]|uniref:NADPH:quinone reductase n=1 Tax=Streptomyces finlayi TaxID=67296 RepID=A0A918X2E7_9ACTN|nr:NAD(P)-dependent alcohol dehydrogenase [Streptomyces finlayi]GHA22299.1 NADPH:quinone reductase [Streptomyces spiroverticillatus]GHD04317.1 NADPH:quinone reductase [Streptomyces finlayi]
MKAIVRYAYGSADVLRLAEVEQPRPRPGHVLVRVHAAGIDRGVLHFLTGHPYPLRLAGTGLRTPTSPFLGRELAGTVESVGEGVTGFAPGDEVFGIGEGAFAEYAVAPAEKLVPKPHNLTFPQAAALGISALTALQGLRDHGGVAAGQRVLITGASGGVGTFAVQLAWSYGAEVTGVCRTAKADLVRKLGADHVIDHTREDFADGKHHYDVILDLAGNPSLARLRKALTPTGTAVIGGGETSGRMLSGFDRQLRALAVDRFVKQRLTTYICSENRRDLVVLKGLAEAGRLTPAVDRTYPLAETADALRALGRGEVRGKLAVVMPGC